MLNRRSILIAAAISIPIWVSLFFAGLYYTLAGVGVLAAIYIVSSLLWWHSLSTRSKEGSTDARAQTRSQ